MTKREIASLVIKLMGVFILLKSISYVPMALGGMFYQWQSSEVSGILFSLFFIVVVFGISLLWALFIIVRSDRIATWLLSDDMSIDTGTIEFSSAITKEDVMRVSLSCIGVFVIVTAIPNLIQYLIHYLTYFRPSCQSQSGSCGLVSSQLLRLIAPVVQIGLGVWLFAGSRGIVKLWKKVRN